MTEPLVRPREDASSGSRGSRAGVELRDQRGLTFDCSSTEEPGRSRQTRTDVKCGNSAILSLPIHSACRLLVPSDRSHCIRQIILRCGRMWGRFLCEMTFRSYGVSSAHWMRSTVFNFCKTAAKWQEAMIHWQDRPSLSFALMAVSCEALKPSDADRRQTRGGMSG
jgi:hypothetical protein